MFRIRHLTLTFMVWLCGMSGDMAAQTRQALPTSLNSALQLVDEELEHRQENIDRRRAFIESLRYRLNTATSADSAYVLFEMAIRTEGLSMDSCLIFLEKGAAAARRAGLGELALKMDMVRFSRLPQTGSVGAATEGMRQIRDSIKQIDPRLFMIEGSHMALLLADLYPEGEGRLRYLRLAGELTDSLAKLDWTGHESEGMLYKSGSAAVHGDWDTYSAELIEMIERTPIEDRNFAKGAASLGDYYHRQGMLQKAAYYYALATASDLHNGIREGVAMMRLGAILFDIGDLDRSHRLLTESVAQSEISGSYVRKMEALNVLPKVSEAFNHENHRRVVWLGILSGCLVLALGAVGLMMHRGHRQMLRMRELQQRLRQSNDLKEHSMARFLELSSIYAERLEEFARLARRKLAAGQVEELHQMLKSGNIGRDQTKMFCEMFDNTLQHLFPTFVTDLNRLLLPDKQMEVPTDDTLNPELRIVAFERLGITDSQRISRFLGITVNSVYTYRTRTRARAINRDTFDADLQKIGAVDGI